MQGKNTLDLDSIGADMHMPFDRFYEKYIYGNPQFCDEVAVVGTVAWERKKNDLVRVIEDPRARPSELHREITHRNLMLYANALAAFIRTKFIDADGQAEIPKNTVIPIYLGRTIDTIVAMLAVIRAGAAFVLLDDVEIEAGKVVACERFKQYLSSVLPNDPDKTEGISIKYLLTTREKWRDDKEKIHTPNGDEPIYLDECMNKIKLDTPMQSFSCPDQLGYIVYSSGTTGKPKGILIPNSGLVSRVLSHYAFLSNNDYKMGPTDKVPLTAPLRFDASIMQVFLGLSCGGSVHVIEERTRISVPSLYSYLKTYKMTASILVPSQWRELDRMAPAEPKIDLPYLRVILSTGEAFDKKLIARWLACGEKVRLLVNGYGPSETTVGLTLCLVRGDDQQVTITVKVGLIEKVVDLISVGEPMLGTKLLIVERQETYNGALKVIAEIANGEKIKVYKESEQGKIAEGEIIAFDIGEYKCRAKGYINEPAKNRLNFLSIIEKQGVKSEPEYIIGEDAVAMSAYRTGDRGCVIGGKLFVTGRYGVNQLKKYGQLVSIEEIQEVLKSYLEYGKYPIFKSVLVSDYLSKESLAQQFVAYLNDDDITYIKYDESPIDLDSQASIFYAIDIKNKKICLYRNKKIVTEQNFDSESLKALEELEKQEGLLSAEDKDRITQVKSDQRKLLRYAVFPELRSTADEELYISLRDFAKQYLNTYMLPSRWAIKTISENGKADTTKLPSNELKKIYRKNPLRAVVALNTIADCVKQAWNKVFDDIETSCICNESKFDELGGDSHAYTMMLAELQQLLAASNILDANDFNQDIRLKLLGLRKFEDFISLLYTVEQAKKLPVMMAEYPMVPMDEDLQGDREKIEKTISSSGVYLFQSPFAMQDDLTDLYLPLRKELTLRRPVSELKLPSDFNPIFGGKTFAQQLAFHKPKIIQKHYGEKNEYLILAGHSAGGMLAYRMAQEIGREYPHIKIMVIMLDTTSSHLPRKITFDNYVNYIKEFIDKTLSRFYYLLDKNNIAHCFMNDMIGKVKRDFRLPENIADGIALTTKQQVLADAEKFIAEILNKLIEIIEKFSFDIFSIPHSDCDQNSYIRKVVELYTKTRRKEDLAAIEAQLTVNSTVNDLYLIVKAEVQAFKANNSARIEFLQRKFSTMLNFCCAELDPALNDSMTDNVKVLLMTSFTEYPQKISGYGFTGLEQEAYLLWESSNIDQPPIKFVEIQRHSDFIAKSDNKGLIKIACAIEKFLGVSGHVNRLLRTILPVRLTNNFSEKNCFIDPLCLDGRELKANIMAILQDRNNSENEITGKSILLTGDAGMGKTQFSLHLARDLWAAYYKSEFFIPIYIDLKEICAKGFLSLPSMTLLESLVEVLRRNMDFPEALSDKMLLDYLRSNNLIYIIDGCDEIEGNKLEYIFSSCMKDLGDPYGKRKIRQVIFTCREEALLGFDSEMIQKWFSKHDLNSDLYVDYKQIRMRLWGNQQILHYLSQYAKSQIELGFTEYTVRKYQECFSYCCAHLPEFAELIRTPLLLRMIAPKLPEIVNKLIKNVDDDLKKVTSAKIYAYFFVEWIRREEDKALRSNKVTQLLPDFRRDRRLSLYSAIYTINLAIKLWKISYDPRGALSFNADLSKNITEGRELLNPNLHASNVLMQVLDDASCFCDISEINTLKRNFEELKKIHSYDEIFPIDFIRTVRSCSLLKVTSYRETKFKFIHKSVNEYITGTSIFNKLQILALDPADFPGVLVGNDQLFINIRPVRDQPNIIKIIKQEYRKGDAKCEIFLNKLWMLIDLSRQYKKLKMAASNAVTLISAIDPLFFCNRDLSNTRIAFALISKSLCHNTNFNYADLSRAIFIDSDFFGASFFGAKLSGSLAKYLSTNVGVKNAVPAIKLDNPRRLPLKDSTDLLDLRYINDSWFVAHKDGHIYRLKADLKEINESWPLLGSDAVMVEAIKGCFFTDDGGIFYIVQDGESIRFQSFAIPMKYSASHLVDRFSVEISDISKVLWFNVNGSGKYLLLKGEVGANSILYLYQIYSGGLSRPICKFHYNPIVEHKSNLVKGANFSPNAFQAAVIHSSSNLLLTIDLMIKDNPLAKLIEFSQVNSELQVRSYASNDLKPLSCDNAGVFLHAVTYANNDTDVYAIIEVSPRMLGGNSELFFSRYDTQSGQIITRHLNFDSSARLPIKQFYLHYDNSTERFILIHNIPSFHAMYLIDKNLNIIVKKEARTGIGKVIFSNYSRDTLCEFIAVRDNILVPCLVNIRKGELEKYLVSFSNARALVVNGNIYCVVKNNYQVIISVLFALENNRFVENFSWIYESAQDIEDITILSEGRLLIIDLFTDISSARKSVILPIEYIASKLRIIDVSDFSELRNSKSFDSKDIFIIRLPLGKYSLRLISPEKEISLNSLGNNFVSLIMQFKSGEYCNDKELFLYVLSIIALPDGLSLIDAVKFPGIHNNNCIVYDPEILQLSSSHNEASANEVTFFHPSTHGSAALLTGINYKLNGLMPLSLSAKEQQSIRMPCRTLFVEFDSGFMPLLLVCYIKTNNKIDSFTPSIYFPGGVLKLGKHEFSSGAMSGRFTSKAYDFAVSKVAANNTFYLTLYKTDRVTPIWCYKLSKTLNGHLECRNQDYYYTDESLSKIQYCLPSLMHNVVFYVDNTALYACHLDVPNRSRPRLLLHDMNVPITAIQLIGPDEKKLLVLTNVTVYIFEIAMIQKRPQQNVLWVGGQYQPNYAFANFSKVHCESTMLNAQLNSLMVTNARPATFLSIKSYRPCSSMLFKVGKLRTNNHQLICSRFDNHKQFSINSSLITVFCEARFRREHKPMEFAIEYTLNAKIFVMLYQFSQKTHNVSCTDISSDPNQFVRNRRDWLLVHKEIGKDGVEDGIKTALELESYIHGTIDCLSGREGLENNWINWAFRRINLAFENLAFVQADNTPIEEFHHYQ
jgi:non-ribosomal peptide synthetase component F